MFDNAADNNHCKNNPTNYCQYWPDTIQPADSSPNKISREKEYKSKFYHFIDPFFNQTSTPLFLVFSQLYCYILVQDSHEL